MNHYKFYPDGDRDPVERKTYVILTREKAQAGDMWYFTCQKEPLPDEYLDKLKTSLSEGRCRVYCLDEHFATQHAISCRKALRFLFHIY